MAKKKLTQEQMAQQKENKIAEAKKKYYEEAESKLAEYKAELDMEPEELELKNLEDRLAEIKAKKIKVKNKKDIRDINSEDTRRKILMGAFIKSMPDKWNEYVQSQGFYNFLERPIDKQLFGLQDKIETPKVEDQNNQEKSEDKEAESTSASADNTPSQTQAETAAEEDKKTLEIEQSQTKVNDAAAETQEAKPEKENIATSETKSKSSEYSFEPRPDGGVYLDVPKDYKETAKSFKAKWDPSAQKWYAPDGIDPEPIQRAVDEVKNKIEGK